MSVKALVPVALVWIAVAAAAEVQRFLGWFDKYIQGVERDWGEEGEGE